MPLGFNNDLKNAIFGKKKLGKNMICIWMKCKCPKVKFGMLKHSLISMPTPKPNKY
jgi:hypothetical protein